MAEFQTTFAETFPTAVVGMVANSEPYNSISRTGDVALNFGVPVIRGAGDHTVAVATAAGEIMGLTVRNPGVPANAANPDQYPAKFTVTLMTQGVMWGLADATVADGDQARWNSVSQRWTNAAASTTVWDVPGAEFEISGTAGSLVKIRYVRVPATAAAA